MVDKTKLQEFWSGQITKSKKREANWRKEGDNYVKIYKDGFANHESKPSDANLAKAPFNILWSNTEILKAATLSRISPPNVTRRYKDENKVAKEASEMMERSLEFVHDQAMFTRGLRQARDDMLLPGRGTMWFEYRTETALLPMEKGIIAGEDEEEIEVFLFNDVQEEPDDIDENGNGFFEDLVDQSVEPKFVYWKDYLQSDSRSEELVWWKARRHGMSVDEIKDQLKLDEKRMSELFESPQAQNDEETDVLEVWEIWAKPNKQRIWYTESSTDTLLVEKVPLTLTNFFPSPKPLFPFETTNTMVPVPEYRIYKHLATELNRIEKRLSKLTGMMKVAGVYDGANNAEVMNLDDLQDGQYKPIGDAKNFGDRGGLNGAFFDIPLAGTSAVIQQLETRKAILKAEIFEITGISDVMRGDTNANETAEAQKIKGSYGSLRLRPRREPIEEFIRDSYEIMGEIMADKFLPETFSRMTGLNPSEEVMALIRDDAMRTFMIDVETDSTVQPNQAIDQRKAVEYTQAMGSFFAQALPVVEAAPQMAPLAMEMIKFTSRQFKVGRTMEEEVNKLADQIEQSAAQPKQPEATPEQQIEQAKMQLELAKLDAERQKIQLDSQTKLQIAGANVQIKQAEIQQREREGERKAQTSLVKNVLDVRAAAANG